MGLHKQLVLWGSVALCYLQGSSALACWHTAKHPPPCPPSCLQMPAVHTHGNGARHAAGRCGDCCRDDARDRRPAADRGAGADGWSTGKQGWLVCTPCSLHAKCCGRPHACIALADDAASNYATCSPALCPAQVAQAGLHLLTDSSKVGTALVVLVDGSWVEPQRTRFKSGACMG